MNYGQAVRAQKLKEKREGKKFYPNGFDISLADVISEFDLSEVQIQKIGELTVQRKIASATVGHNVYYRRSTMTELFGEPKAKTINPMDARPSV